MKVGVDIANVSRFENFLNDEKALKRVFTSREIEHIFMHNTNKGRLERGAGKFCAKEAFSKALGLGISEEVNFVDIEILPDKNNRPTVTLYRTTKQKFETNFSKIDISISHDGGMAIAFCVIDE